MNNKNARILRADAPRLLRLEIRRQRNARALDLYTTGSHRTKETTDGTRNTFEGNAPEQSTNENRNADRQKRNQHRKSYAVSFS